MARHDVLDTLVEGLQREMLVLSHKEGGGVGAGDYRQGMVVGLRMVIEQINTAFKANYASSFSDADKQYLREVKGPIVKED